MSIHIKKCNSNNLLPPTMSKRQTQTRTKHTKYQPKPESNDDSSSEDLKTHCDSGEDTKDDISNDCDCTDHDDCDCSYSQNYDKSSDSGDSESSDSEDSDDEDSDDEDSDDEISNRIKEQGRKIKQQQKLISNKLINLPGVYTLEIYKLKSHKYNYYFSLYQPDTDLTRWCPPKKSKLVYRTNYDTQDFNLFAQIINKLKYMINLQLYRFNLKEGYTIKLFTKEIDRLEEKLYTKIVTDTRHGITNVVTPSGTVDILTKKHLIYVKKFDQWRVAFDQMMVESLYYAEKDKLIYLYNVPDNTNEIELVQKVFNEYDIKFIIMSLKY